MVESLLRKPGEKARFSEFRDVLRGTEKSLLEILDRVKRESQKVHPLFPSVAVMVGSTLIGYALMQNPATMIGTAGSGFVFNVGVLDFSSIAKTQPQSFINDVILQAGQTLSNAFLGYRY